MGTRYDPQTRGGLVAYRGTSSLRKALDFAVGQLQRQGFERTFRTYPDSGPARALLRRHELLMEVRITQGAQDVTRAPYLFRNGELPERGYVGRTVVLKLRYEDGTRVTRHRTREEPLATADALAQAAAEVLTPELIQEHRVRLLGVSVVNLSPRGGA